MAGSTQTQLRFFPQFFAHCCLTGVEAGRRISEFKIDPGTSERLGQLATAAVGDGG